MATKKAPAKTSARKTAATRQSGKSPSKTAAAKQTAAKSASAKAAGSSAAKSASAKKAPAKKPSTKHKAAEDNYTEPELREHIKEEVMAGDKGGKPGQWSARKAQLVAHEYVAEGGGYKHPRNEAQKHLKEWGEEHWHTADGKPAIRDDGHGHQETHRYLPDEAWKELSPEEQKATDEKKVRGSRKGKQFVANTEKASAARHHAAEKVEK